MTTSMATKRELTKGWIDFLKRNQIVDLKSNPDGKLNYRKPVTADLLLRYLRNTAEFQEEDIKRALRQVLANKATNGQPPQASSPEKLPPEQKKQLGAPERPKLGTNVSSPAPAAPKKKYSTDDATDIDFKDINEAIIDRTGIEISEDDVESVFRILTTPAAPATEPAQVVDKEAEFAKRSAELNRIKRMIRELMTDSQRKALWRALTDA